MLFRSALPDQPCREKFGLDVAVVALDLVAQIFVAQSLQEQRDDTGLGALFYLAYSGQFCNLSDEAFPLPTRFGRALLPV